MNDAVFALIEDPAVPVPDLVPPPSPDVPLAAGEPPPPPKPVTRDDIQNRPHRRTSFVTIRPPESLELLLHQLQSKWIPVRQSGGTASAKFAGLGAPQVTVEGIIFSIGTDWVVRAGNVIIAGGILRGMLLEAEYLPLPISPKPVLTPDDTADLLSNLLTSLLPSGIESKTIVFPITDAQWEDVLFDTDDRGENNKSVDEDVFISAEESIPTAQRGDWTGVHRDQRSAFLVIGALKSEGIL